VSGSRLDQSLSSGASNRDILDEFYLAVLSRYPSEDEVNRIVVSIAETAPLADNSFFTQTDQRREALEDLVWAILCSREFAYNH